MLMIVLDVTVVNVALPSIQDDLGFSQSSLAWVVNGYLITFGGLLLLAGRFGDLVGRKNVFMAGLALFTVASIACGLAQSQGMLVAGRFVQGIGGAMTSAVILGMIVTMFPEPREQAKAIGVYAFVASAGGTIGLLAGGVLTEAISWHWIFFINVPIAIATALLATRLIERDQGIGLDKGADTPGALLITTSLMLGVYTIVKPAAEQGWGDPQTLGLGAVSLALLVAFVVREAKAANPLMPLRIFRSRNVSGANVVEALLVAGMFGDVLHGLPVHAGGARLRPASDRARVPARDADHGDALGALRRAADHALRRPPLADLRHGPGRGLAGAVHPGRGRRQLRRAHAAGDDPARLRDRGLLPGADVARDVGRDAGRTPASPPGLVNTSAQIGGAIGLAVLATLSTTRTENLLADGESQAAALTGGYHLAFWIGAALVVAALGVALTVLQPEDASRRRRPRGATPTVISARPREPRIRGRRLSAASRHARGARVAGVLDRPTDARAPARRRSARSR